jgi:Tfp pilus assembly protein PilN
MTKNLTILLITRDLLVRADFRLRGKKPTVAGFWQQPRPAVEDFPALVEAAMRLGPKRAGRVWVLSSEIWSQTLELPSETVSGLAGDELDRALAFEAEPLSGIGAFDSRVSHVELPAASGGRRFWLCQVLNSHLEQIEYLVEQAGGRLAGLGHPGGLPRPIDDATDVDGCWRRIEFWPDAVLWLRAEPNRPLAVQVLNADPRSDRWRAEWASRLETPTGQEHTETLRGTGVAPDAAVAGDRVVDLNDTLQLEAWLAAWAGQLAKEQVGLPLVAPPRRPLSAGKLWAVAAAVALFGVAVCVGHYKYLQHREGVLAAEIASLKEPKQELEDATKKADGLDKQLTEIRQQTAEQRENLEYFQQVMLAQRRRFARLLAVLARQSNDGLLIQAVEGDGTEVTVHGICLAPELANRLATRLNQELASLGWQVDPPEKEAQVLLTGGGPWKFELRLTEVPDWNPSDLEKDKNGDVVRTADRIPAT